MTLKALARWTGEGGAVDAAPLADARSDFPGLVQKDGTRWHYLDTAATALKPQQVIDATVTAMGVDYATVHRGVYARSADMTRRYEAARARMATFLGAASADEVVFTRGATEAINLVAASWGRANLRPGDRIMLSLLEHHSNIVPWQMLAEATGAVIDVCPLTPDLAIDVDALDAMLTERHRIVALAHVSNVLGSLLDVAAVRKACDRVGARLLLDGCQAVAHAPVDVTALGCDFYVCSAHKLYGPTGIGALWARGEVLDAMPAWQGGGAMIDRVTFARTSYAPAPQRFEAGTPAIIEAVGLHAAVDYIDAIGRGAIAQHEAALTLAARTALADLPGIRVLGGAERGGIVSFVHETIHPHDLGTILDDAGVAIRAGHHCAQPLMDHLGLPATARASFGLHSDFADIDALVAGLTRAIRIFA